MRIIAGIFGGRRLKAEVADSTRPTSDRVREALASALDVRGAFYQASVLDLFAGTGALGFEALSRGALRLVSIDNDKRAIRCITDNARTLGVSDRVNALSLDLLDRTPAAVERLVQLKPVPFTLVFADPPYSDAGRVPALFDALKHAELLAPGALIAFEYASTNKPQMPTAFEEVSSYRYGSTSTTILAHLG